eukprot:scaffold141890_cov20-Tisochrysis_lutea.AAC.2
MDEYTHEWNKELPSPKDTPQGKLKGQKALRVLDGVKCSHTHTHLCRCASGGQDCLEHKVGALVERQVLHPVSSSPQECSSERTEAGGRPCRREALYIENNILSTQIKWTKGIGTLRRQLNTPYTKVEIEDSCRAE